MYDFMAENTHKCLYNVVVSISVHQGGVEIICGTATGGRGGMPLISSLFLRTR